MAVKEICPRQIQHAQYFSFKRLVQPGGFDSAGEAALVLIELLIERITQHGDIAREWILDQQRDP